MGTAHYDYQRDAQGDPVEDTLDVDLVRYPLVLTGTPEIEPHPVAVLLHAGGKRLLEMSDGTRREVLPPRDRASERLALQGGG